MMLVIIVILLVYEGVYAIRSKNIQRNSNLMAKEENQTVLVYSVEFQISSCVLWIIVINFFCDAPHSLINWNARYKE